MRPATPLAVENSVGKLAANARQMSARERECGELPSPNLSLFDRKVRQGLFVLWRVRLVLDSHSNLQVPVKKGLLSASVSPRLLNIHSEFGSVIVGQQAFLWDASITTLLK